VPPSQDANRKTQTTRKVSNRKVGGQKGHKGYKLNKVPNADKIIKHDITECKCCKNQLPAAGEIETLKKSNQNILTNIQNAFDNKPFLPKLAE